MSVRSRRVRLDLAYDGTEFAGWQVQPGRRTVQGILEQALARVQGGRPAVARGAGRTDSGVHAEGQVADCELLADLDDAALEHALAGLLPADLRVWRVRTVAPEFHARKDAASKTYRYRLDRSRRGNPFLDRYALHHPQPIDARAVREAVALLPGRGDWSGFAGAGGGAKDGVRHLLSASFEESSPVEASFSFTANGFLRYMVRNLVGTLLAIGQGRLPVPRIRQIVDSRDRTLGGPTAPAHGLCLERVVYPGGNHEDQEGRPRLAVREGLQNVGREA